VCDVLGIDWSTPFRKIMADEVLSTSVGEMPTEVNRADSGRKTPRTAVMLPIEFANDWLFTIKIKDDAVFGGCVGERPTRDSLGIDWNGQRVKIKADPVLSSTVENISTVAADGKKRVQTMLPFEYANRSRYLYGYH